MRHALLYAPAFVCGALALVFGTFGRSDGTVIAGAVALGISMALHAYQEVHDRGREPAASDPRFPWLPERFYRDVWLFAISVVVTLAAFNADSLAERIQAQRLELCRDQNAKYDNTIRALDRVLLERISDERVNARTDPDVVARELAEALSDLSPGERARRVESRTYTILLIKQIAPKRDCQAQIRSDGP